MIVKIRYENQWTYIADVERVKTEEAPVKKTGVLLGGRVEEVPVFVGKLYVFYRDRDKNYEVVELEGNAVYLLTDEGKTIERIN